MEKNKIYWIIGIAIALILIVNVNPQQNKTKTTYLGNGNYISTVYMPQLNPLLRAEYSLFSMLNINTVSGDSFQDNYGHYSWRSIDNQYPCGYDLYYGYEDDGDIDIARIWIDWDISSIPSNAVIESVTFNTVPSNNDISSGNPDSVEDIRAMSQTGKSFGCYATSRSQSERQAFYTQLAQGSSYLTLTGSSRMSLACRYPGCSVPSYKSYSLNSLATSDLQSQLASGRFPFAITTSEDGTMDNQLNLYGMASSSPPYLTIQYHLPCVPATCVSLGKTCGSWSDGCSNTLTCGTCGLDSFCSSGTCVLNCTSNWVTGSWSTCVIGNQTRTVTDSNSCTTPTGIKPATSQSCTVECIPSCLGKVCGDNGCSGTCGSCQNGQTCSNGTCLAGTCTPTTTCAANTCVGQSCSDGCNGSVAGTKNCTVTCTPSCSGKTCGDNGCNGSCGNCSSGKTCQIGQCSTGTCIPSNICALSTCIGTTCDNGCGESVAGTRNCSSQTLTTPSIIQSNAIPIWLLFVIGGVIIYLIYRRKK